jgi:hypothetical protein
MATVVKSFNLYNTTFYWNGYKVPNFEVELNVAKSYYIAQYSSNIIGSQIDFFAELATGKKQNPVFTVNTTLDKLPYLWSNYWWEEATFYSNPAVSDSIQKTYPEYYQPFSESIGTLYYISRFNNLKNEQTKPYSSIITPLLPPGISDSIDSFYSTANSLFVTNIAAIGPLGTDTNPNNSSLIMADTDLTRRVTSNNALTSTINDSYKKLYKFLPYNTNVTGNLITPYRWSTTLQYEDSLFPRKDRFIIVDQTNRTISTQTQQPLSALKV